MVDPVLPKPTERSGFLCNLQPLELHGANATPPPPPPPSCADNKHPHNEEVCPVPLVNPGTPSSSSSSTAASASSSPEPGPASVQGFTTTDWVLHENAPPLDISQLPSLEIRTDVPPHASQMTSARDSDMLAMHSASSSSLPPRTPSFHGLRAGRNSSISSVSPATSVLSSPQLMAIGDITPLPSPIGGNTPWRLSRTDVSLSRTSSMTSRNGSSIGLRLSDSSYRFGRSTSRSRTRPYTSGERVGERPDAATSIPEPKHARNRSLSDYAPPGRSVHVKPRPIVASGSGPPQGIAPSSSTDSKSNNGLHREQYLAVHRGIALPAARPLTPPRSSRGADDDHSNNGPVISRSASLSDPEEFYSVRSVRSQQPRKYRKLCQLGQGTFSQVNLGARMELEESDVSDRSSMDSLPSTPQKLVAVKVIEYGPAGGADEERLEVSLKREVDILKAINHPSLVQLKAFGSDEKRALLVLDYCPGGDLFDVASSSSRPMSPNLTRRIFAELVAAVRYLHEHFIVHRDIKLENVLVTIPTAAMEKPIDWCTYDRAVVTLSDLGLSRRIPQPPESPLLHTRCGSEDYAAPEILMGQPYDGRSTDAWALGVSLYAMMENRLPFDVLPGTRGDPAKLRARTPHRIARCEWSWYRYADDDEEWDSEKGKDWGHAHECVEGLLKRNTKRKTLDEIAAMPWVRDAIDVSGGLKRADQEVP